MRSRTSNTPEMASDALDQLKYRMVAECEVKDHAGGPWVIRLYQHKRKPDKEERECFAVQYGCQIDEPLTYSEACSKLGEALMHWASCEGLIEQAG